MTDLNEIALKQKEKWNYYGALKSFRKAAKKEPNIQSLTNLACFYLYEGIPINNKGTWKLQIDLSIEILNQVIARKPKSYIPYALLGEAHLNQSNNSKACKYLHRAFEYKNTAQIANNLGVSYFHQKKLLEADYWFSEAVLLDKKKDYQIVLNVGIVKALVGKKKKAEKIADEWIKKRMEFRLEFADIYYATGNFRKYAKFIPKLQRDYYIDSKICSCMIFAYIILQKPNLAKQVVNTSIDTIDLWITQLIEDDNRTKNDLFILELEKEKRKINRKYKHIQKGYIQKLQYTPSSKSDCYYFGCKRHKIPKYSES